jgi:hypothetical protein
MMVNLAQLSERRLTTKKIQASVDLKGVCTDDLSAKCERDLNRKITFTHTGWTGYHNILHLVSSEGRTQRTRARNIERGFK